jgi:hypothetical protein
MQTETDVQGQIDGKEIHRILDETLLFFTAELNDGIDLIKEYGHLPLSSCPSNDVRVILKNSLFFVVRQISKRGVLRLTSGFDGKNVWLELSATGASIPSEWKSMGGSEQIIRSFSTLLIINSMLCRNAGRLHIHIERHDAFCLFLEWPAKVSKSRKRIQTCFDANSPSYCDAVL